jgi:hypothetical protein
MDEWLCVGSVMVPFRALEKFAKDIAAKDASRQVVVGNTTRFIHYIHHPIKYVWYVQ